MLAGFRTNPPLVSLLVVNYNGAGFLRDCLESLRALSYPRYEVVVVDNGSTDGSRGILAEFGFARVIQSGRNLGFAGGNNLGLRHCTGDLVLLLNSDTVVTTGFLEPLVRYLAEHPKVAVVQGKMRLPRFGGVLDACGSFLTPLGFPYHYGYLKPDGPKYQRSYPVFSGKGACLLFRRDVISLAGGFLFDEDFFCYYEESDFCHRVWLCGFETHFVADSIIDHLMGATVGATQKPGFVLRHYLPNMAFSLLGNLSCAGLFRVFPAFLGMHLAGLLAAIGLGRKDQMAAHWAALACPVLRFGKLIERRRLIRSIRRVPDRVLFRRFMRWPGWDYFRKTFAGKLAEYEDEA